MRRSDEQSSDDDELNNNNVSLDETANSIHQQNMDQDKEMAALDPPLKRFIREELKLEIKLDDLQHHDNIFKENQLVAIPPAPSLYFLSHQILIFNRSKSITDIREDILKLNKQYEIRYYSETEQLNVKLHNKSQLVHYNLKFIKIDQTLHSRKEFLDTRHLIDLLFQYYSTYYQKLRFEETASLILYWAYQKQILDQELTEHALKLIVICNFINFGYGVPNVIYHSLNNKEILKENSKLFTFARINAKGETQIDQELKRSHINYTIEEKRGFYMASRKKFMQIKDIIPIYFPIVPLKGEDDVKQQEQARKNIYAVLNNERQKMSICKNIYKIFKFLHNKFDKRMKLVVDFQESLAYRQQFAENFELQILHPVTNKSICSIKDQSIRKLKSEINSIYEGFTKSFEPISVIKEMLAKKRG